LGFSEGNDGEAANSDEWRIREEFFRFDFGQCDGLGERLSGFDLNRGILGIGSVYGDNGSGADGALAVTGFVDDQFVAGLHPAKILHGDRIRNAVPYGGLVAPEIGERVRGGFGFQQIEGRHIGSAFAV